MKKKMGIIIAITLVLSFIVGGVYIHNENEKKAAIAIAESIKKEEARLQKEKEEKRLQKEKEAQAIAAKEKAIKDKATAEATLAATVANPKASNYREFFKDDVFMGDSISEGLFYYEYLDEDRVIAKKGASITKAADYVDDIVSLKPNRIFIMYGVNNMEDTTPSTWFVDQYRKLIVAIKQKNPNAKIYVQSVMPVREEIVHKTNPHITNVHINECNEGLKAMAIQQGINYINVGSVLNDSNKNLYEVDGTHFVSKFYPVWLNYIKSNLL